MVHFTITILFFLLFCAFFQFQPATLDEVAAQNDAQKPLLSKVFMDTVSLLRKSHKNSWNKIKTAINDLQMHFSPPNLDFRSGGEVREDMKGTLKAAVQKSLERSKETFEESAETAAKAVETKIHKTAENKMHKNTAYDSEHESKTEL
ncbi:hypothetical protein ACSQ67_004699 [Phaseolus vulgaris]